MKSPKIYYQINLLTNGMPEVPAHFPGGLGALNHFIHEHLSYSPQEQTIIVAEFIINEYGEVVTPKIMISLSNEFDQVLLEVLSQMPTWTPARNAGAIVPVRVNLPILFDHADNQRISLKKANELVMA